MQTTGKHPEYTQAEIGATTIDNTALRQQSVRLGVILCQVNLDQGHIPRIISDNLEQNRRREW